MYFLQLLIISHRAALETCGYAVGLDLFTLIKTICGGTEKKQQPKREMRDQMKVIFEDMFMSRGGDRMHEDSCAFYFFQKC